MAGLIAMGGALATSTVAAAEPPPPVDPLVPAPAPAPPPDGAVPSPDQIDLRRPMLATPPPPPAGVPPQATIGSPLLQAGQTPQGILGGGLQDPKALLDIPSILGTPPAPTAWNNQYMLPQYETPSAPGSNTPMAGIPEGQELENTNMRGLLKRIHGQYKEGNLQGGFLGQRPEESLGQPLEGTAPPPGTNLPAGLEQFQPPPPDPAMAPPPPPGAPPVPLPPGAPLPPG